MVQWFGTEGHRPSWEVIGTTPCSGDYCFMHQSFEWKSWNQLKLSGSVSCCKPSNGRVDFMDGWYLYQVIQALWVIKVKAKIISFLGQGVCKAVPPCLCFSDWVSWRICVSQTLSRCPKKYLIMNATVTLRITT